MSAEPATRDRPSRDGMEERGAAATLRRLRVFAVLGTFVLIVVLDVVREAIHPFLLSWAGRLVMGGAIFLAAVVLLGGMFNVVERLYRSLERRNRELLELHDAALDIYGELSLEAVLQRVVDRACLLVQARYGALSMIDEQGRIKAFIVSGISAAERAALAGPPRGEGLLGVPLREGRRLRIASIADDPRATGFPANHPPMHSLLAVPILCGSPSRGNLYLADRLDGEEFSAEDEETLARFATKAAIAINQAHLHQRLSSLAVAEERLRIARDMHDGLAQVLAYVNTKAQAVNEYLRGGRTEEAARQLDQLAGAARDVYADVRASILGLRTAPGPDRPLAAALADLGEVWQEQSGIPCELHVQDGIRLPQGAELQLLRIVQEALANVRKHAQARRAEVTFERGAGGGVMVSVADDGVGFNPDALRRAQFPRFGLATMRERAESIGGRMRLESPAGGGTRVVVELPGDRLRGAG